MLIPPRYDAIGEPVRLLFPLQKEEVEDDTPKYRLVEVSGKLGILDYNLQETLPCVYDFILPISAQQFLVKEAAGHTIVDTSGRSISGKYYQQLSFAGAVADGTCLYAFKEEGKTGIINANGDILLPARFAVVKLLKWRSDLFLTRTTTRTDVAWTLSNSEGTPVVKKTWAAKAPHPGLLLLQEDEGDIDQYQAFTAEGKRIPVLDTLSFVDGQYLSPELVRLKKERWNKKTRKMESKEFLFNIRFGRVLLPDYLKFRALDGQYVIGVSRRPSPSGNGLAELETILSPQGQPLDSSNWHRVIKPWLGTEKQYLIRGQLGWGITDSTGKELGLQAYSNIGPLEEQLAIVQRNNLQGIITADGRTVVAPEFSYIQRRGKQLVLENDAGTTIMYLDDSLNVISLREYQRMRALHVGAAPTSLRIARRMKWSSLRTNSSLSSNGDTDTSFEDLNDIRLARWFSPDSEMPNTSTQRTPLPEAKAAGLTLDFLQKYNSPSLTPKYFMRFYSPHKMNPSAALQRLASRSFCVKSQRLFADSTGRLYQDSLLGIRTQDFLLKSSFAPALTVDGRFFLLGKDGAPLRNKEGQTEYFTFVGEANNGLLRVCIGGVLDLVDPNENNREILPTFHELMHPFDLRLPCGVLKSPAPSLTVRSLPDNSARWGLIDSLGQWVIPPIYDYLEENIDKQMVARRGVGYGVIDLAQNTIVPFQYLAIRNYQNYWRVNNPPLGDLYFNWRGHQIMDADTEDAAVFREGYCPRLAQGRWHFINERGEQVGDKDFVAVKPFGEGLAAVRTDSTHWAFIDTSGQVSKTLAEKPYHDIGYFVGGRCWFRRGSRYGFLDPNMKEVVPPIYSSVENFTLGRANVNLREGAAVIDTVGNYFIPAGQYTAFKDWTEQGITVATVANQGQFIVDSLGRKLHEKAYAQIELTGEGPYAMKQGRLWGYLNAQGREVIAPKYRAARSFFDERAAVKPPVAGGNWVFIGPQGRQINRQVYSSINDFSHGTAWVFHQNSSSRLLQTNGKERIFDDATILFSDGELVGCGSIKKQFFTDQQGNRVFANTFDKIEAFGSSETAAVTRHGRKGIVDRRGMILVPCKYYKFEARADGTYLVGPPAFGIYDREGKLVVPVEFDNLLLLEGELFRVERGEKIGYLKTDGTVIWELGN